MLVRRDACRQNFGDDGVGDDGEAEVDRSCCRRVFNIVHLTQCQHKSEDAILVVHQNVFRLPTLHAAERERRSRGKAQGIDRAVSVESEWHGVRVVTEFDSFFH